MLGLGDRALECRSVATNLGFLLWAAWSMVRCGLHGHIFQATGFWNRLSCWGSGYWIEDFSCQPLPQPGIPLQPGALPTAALPTSREVQLESRNHLNSFGEGPGWGG